MAWQPCGYWALYWSEWPDLNRRPLDPQSSALPGCATLRNHLSANKLLAVNEGTAIIPEIAWFSRCLGDL
jgi:hypothetical protein